MQPYTPCRSLLRRWLTALVLAAAHCHAAAADVVVMDRPTNGTDRRRDYAAQLLHEVMERTTAEYGPYRLEWAALPMERERLLNEMLRGKHVNTVANPANAQWLAALRSVPVPIDLGLQSWRLLLIDRKNQGRLRQLAVTGKLRQAAAGAGNTWVLNEVLQQNGYGTVTGNSYDGLFYMLQAGRFDYLPRGIHEIFPEFERHRRTFPALAVEDGIVLNIPIPSLFFISPGEERLHRRITAGMEGMLKDGSLERLVLSFYQRDLARAGLCGRLRIALANPALDPAMEARTALWLDPFEPRHGLCPHVAERGR